MEPFRCNTIPSALFPWCITSVHGREYGRMGVACSFFSQFLRILRVPLTDNVHLCLTCSLASRVDLMAYFSLNSHRLQTVYKYSSACGR